MLAAVHSCKISPSVLLPLLRSPMLPTHTLDAVRLILAAAQPPPPPLSHSPSAQNLRPGTPGSSGSTISSGNTRPTSFPPSPPASQFRPNPNKLPTSYRPSNPSLASPPRRDPTHHTHTQDTPLQHQLGQLSTRTPQASDAANPPTSAPSHHLQQPSPHELHSSSSSEVPVHAESPSGPSGQQPPPQSQGGGIGDGGGSSDVRRPSTSAQQPPPGQPQAPLKQQGQPELLSLAHTALKELTARYQRASASLQAKAAATASQPVSSEGGTADAGAPVLANPQGTSSSADGAVRVATAEAGIPEQSEGQVPREGHQRSQQQQQQQQQSAPQRAQQLQLQEQRDSVLARPRLGHLIACARMVVDAELSFGGPARAPHALAAAMVVLPEIVRSRTASSGAARAHFSTDFLQAHGSLDGARDGARDGIPDGARDGARGGARAWQWTAQEPDSLEGAAPSSSPATPSAANVDNWSDFDLAPVHFKNGSDDVASTAGLHPACIAEQQEGSRFLAEVFRKLLHKRQPFLALQVWKALFNAGHPLAVPLGAELAAHCARSNVEAALQSVLAEAITAAAPLLRPPPRKPSSPPPSPSAPAAPAPDTPPFPKHTSSMPSADIGTPGASGGGGGGGASGSVQGSVGGAYNSIVASTGNLFGAGTVASAESSSNSRSNGAESSSGSGSSGSTAQGGRGWRGESTSMDRAYEGGGGTIAQTDARTLQSTRLLQQLLDGLLLCAVDPQGHFRQQQQQQQQQQSSGSFQFAEGVPASLPSSSPATAGWGASGIVGMEGLGSVGDLDTHQRQWLSKYLAEGVVRAVLSTPYFPSRVVCEVVVQALLPTRPASSFAATLLAASAGTNVLAATSVTRQWADHGAMALEVLQGSGLNVQARLLSLAVETANYDQTGYVLGMLDAILTAEGNAAAARALRADNARAVSSSPPLNGSSSSSSSGGGAQRGTISRRESDGGQDAGTWRWPSPMEPKTLLRTKHAACLCHQASAPLEGPLPHVLVALFRVAVFYGASSTQPSILTTTSSSRRSSSIPAGGRSGLSAVGAAEAAYPLPGSDLPAHARPAVEAKVVLAHALIASRPPVPVMHPSMPPRTTPSPPKSDRPTTTSTSTTTSKTSTSANSMGRPSADKHTEECYVLQELNWEKEEDGQIQLPPARVLVPPLSPSAEYYMEAVQLLNLHFTQRPPFQTIKIVNSSSPMSVPSHSTPHSSADSTTTSRSNLKPSSSSSSSYGSSKFNSVYTPGQVRVVPASTKLEKPPLDLFLGMVLRTKAAWTAPHLRYLLQHPCSTAIAQAVPMAFKGEPPLDASAAAAPAMYPEDPAFVESQRKAGRSLLIKALLVGLKADVLPGIAKDLRPEYILRAAGVALQSKLDPEAPRLLLKHFTAHHGLRAASLAPYFVEFVNNLASVCWLEGVEQEVSFGSSTSSSGSSQDSKGGWTSISSLGGCEEYIVSILVSLSRSKEVDLAHGLTAPAKRLAIQLCAAQGKNKTVLRLWQAWHVRHSPLDLGKAALGWLLVACAQGKEWAVGEQLLRLLSPLILSAPSAPTAAFSPPDAVDLAGAQQQQLQVQGQQQPTQQLPPVTSQQRQPQQQDPDCVDEQQRRQRQRQRPSSRASRLAADEAPQRLGSRLAGAYLSLLAAMTTAPDGQYLAVGAQRGVSAVAAAAAAAEAVAPPSAGAAAAAAAVAVGQPTQDQLLEQLGTLPELLDAAFSRQPEQGAIQAQPSSVQGPKGSDSSTTNTTTTSTSTSNSSSVRSSASSSRKRRGKAGSSTSQELDSSQRGENGRALGGRSAPTAADKIGQAPRGSSAAAAAAAAGARGRPLFVQGAGAVGGEGLISQQVFMQQLVMQRVVNLLTLARQQDEGWRRANAGVLLADYKLLLRTLSRSLLPTSNAALSPSLNQKRRGRKVGSSSSKKRSSSSSSKSKRRGGEDGVEGGGSTPRKGRNGEGASENG